MASLKIFLLTIIIFGFALVLPVLAVSPSSILVDMAPTSPAPYSNVDITLQSFAVNLDSVTITWVVDGKNALSGVGKKSFSMTTGASGSETKILVKILLPDGEIDKTVIIRPSTLVLLWQANDSYVPPFYKGKALPAPDSEIKIVAVPEIQTPNGMVDPKNMTYFWKRDYANEQSGSGYGKNFLTYQDDYLKKSSSVSVQALTVDQKYSTEGQISVGSVTPEILFYKKTIDLGTEWETALPKTYILEGEEVVVAAPYFISPKDIRRPELVWNWFINDAPVASVAGLSKNVLPLRVEGGVSGTSQLRLEIENTRVLFQSVSKAINIQF